RLAIFEDHRRLHPLRRPPEDHRVGARDRRREQVRRVGEGKLRLHLKVYLAVTQDDGQKADGGAERPELDAGDGAAAGRAARQRGDGLLAAGDELGGAAAQRDELRLGQDLDEVVVAQRRQVAGEALLVVDDAEDRVRAAGQVGGRGADGGDVGAGQEQRRAGECAGGVVPAGREGAEAGGAGTAG